MLSLKSYFVIFISSIYFSASKAITHWIVTEEGRIQAEHDSIYRLKRPYDLVAFLNQEKLANNVANYFDEMIKRKIEMDRRWSTISSASEVEQRVVSTDEDCIQARNSAEDGDLFMNVIDYASDKLNPKQSIPDDKTIRGNVNLDCKKFARLDFSMATFPHLQVLSQPWNLTWPREIEVKLPLTPKQINFGLSKNKTSWYLYNLASLYWRYMGNSQKALDCVKRAVYYAPREYKDTPLLNLGVMLHRAQCTAEAAIILHSAVDHAPHKPLGHFVLANVYALLGDYNRSIACYNNVLGLDPSWTLARSMRHSIVCHSKVRQGIQDLQRSIQDALKQLKEFQALQESWLKSHDEILQQKAPSPNGSFSLMLTAKSASRLRESCSKKKKSDEILSCDLAPDFKLHDDSKKDPDIISLQKLLSKVEEQAQKISEQIRRPSLRKDYIEESYGRDQEGIIDNTELAPTDWDTLEENHSNFKTDDY